MTQISFGLPSLLLGLAPIVIPGTGDYRPMPIHVSEAQAAEEAAVIAAQIRKQGFVCDRPLRAEAERERSKPNEAVWVLKCQNATYRVRLIPKRAADVERID
ncbi:hypothetical protein [Hyphomicrobium sp.]|uniref:hypothetical protein n=1 Tax=Hyphomicrobium sp. TaxID=82 RepID=UPI0025B97A8B|nr:hypothetical protein [Hyphomicrobium sp.]